MADNGLFQRRAPGIPLVYSIPAHRSFSDALVSGLLIALGRDPAALARGRILLPNSRAVRTVTEAFVRASDGGLVLPRLIVIGLVLLLHLGFMVLLGYFELEWIVVMLAVAALAS